MGIEDKIKKKSLKQLANYSQSRLERIKKVEDEIKELRNKTNREIRAEKKKREREFEDWKDNKRARSREKIKELRDRIDFIKYEEQIADEEIENKLDVPGDDIVEEIVEKNEQHDVKRQHVINLIYYSAKTAMTNITNRDSWVWGYNKMKKILDEYSTLLGDLVEKIEKITEKIDGHKKSSNRVLMEICFPLFNEILELTGS